LSIIKLVKVKFIMLGTSDEGKSGHNKIGEGGIDYAWEVKSGEWRA